MTGQVRTKCLPGLLAGGAMLAVLTGCGSGQSHAATVVVHPAGAVLVGPSGLTSRAAAGERVPAGDTVRAGSAPVLLDTGGRLTTLGAGAVLQVLSTGRADLVSGDVVVVRRAGPGLTLTAGPVTVDRLGRGAVRVDRGFAVLVDAYDTSARVATVAGSGVVAPLHQLLVPGEALPAADSPLSLADDALDLAADPGLVSEDVALTTLAAGVDAQAAQGGAAADALARAVPAGYVQAPAGATTAERILPLAIARAGGSGAAVATRDAQALALREQGGSWAVVASLLRAPLDGIVSQVASVEDTAASGPAGAGGGGIPSVLAGLFTGTNAGASAHGASTTAPGTTPATGAGSSTGGGHGAGSGGHAGGAHPPTGTQSSSGGLGSAPTPTSTLVSELLATLGGLLGGSAATSPAAHPAATHPAATHHAAVSPSPTASGVVTDVTGLAGGVLSGGSASGSSGVTPSATTTRPSHTSRPSPEPRASATSSPASASSGGVGSSGGGVVTTLQQLLTGLLG